MNRLSIAGAASAVLLCASPAALAETSTTTVALSGQTPNPSAPGQSVTLDVTVTQSNNLQNACAGTVDIVDDTDGGSVTVCAAVPITGPAGGPATGTCAYVFPTAGTRSLALSYTGSSGSSLDCASAIGSASQAVGIPVPTLTEWAMWLLAGVLLLGGTAVITRRTQRQSL
ncbi:hypothetical protein [Brevundimonas sp.]